MFGKKKIDLTADTFKALQIFEKITEYLSQPTIQVGGEAPRIFGYILENTKKKFLGLKMTGMPTNPVLHHVNISSRKFNDTYTNKTIIEYSENSISGILVGDKSERGYKISVKLLLRKKIDGSLWFLSSNHCDVILTGGPLNMCFADGGLSVKYVKIDKGALSLPWLHLSKTKTKIVRGH